MRYPVRRPSPPPPADAARCACVAQSEPACGAHRGRSGRGLRRRLLLLGLAAGPLALSTARAQLVRSFPESARLGRLEMRIFPEAVLNDEPVRLAAGARIHDADNRIVMPSTLAGTFDVLVERPLPAEIARARAPPAPAPAAAQARERARASGASGGASR
ncbi:MAG: hypothetical protein KJ011_06310 [Burkholderiaceae bacterium]|nr:hypothetical protein [Burkholderiaceae bacterium]